MGYDIDGLVAIGEGVVERARDRGADVAEVVVSEGRHLSAKVRLGEPELLEEAGSRSLGLRVMRGQQVAVTFTSDLSEPGLSRCVDDALELAALSQPDPFAGPPDASLLSRRGEHADLSLFDPAIDSIDGATALEMARRAERAALDSDSRIDNSDGASVSRQSGASAVVTSGGFRGGVQGTYASIVVHPVASDSDAKKRAGFHWSARRHLAELDDPELVGLEAARRTLAKLGPRKLETREAPVVFDPDVGRTLIGLVGSCVTGGAVWRKASYLAEREGQQIASPLVSVVDDPLLPSGPGSRPYDGEGLLSRRNVVIAQGTLQGFLLDTYSGKKLSRPSTASASRGSSAGVGAGTSNFFMEAGTLSVAELLSSTDGALYVTEMMGHGFNPVTGDFSRAAAGFWVEGGERAFPVSEVTISLNLDDLLKRVDAVADDLDLRTSVSAPTFRVSSMTIAGR